MAPFVEIQAGPFLLIPSNCQLFLTRLNYKTQPPLGLITVYSHVRVSFLNNELNIYLEFKRISFFEYNRTLGLDIYSKICYTTPRMARTTKASKGHGGARPNSGPKPKLEVTLASAQKLASQLKEATRGGLGKLALRYPELMEVAINRALTEDSKEANSILMRLLEMLPRMVRLEDDDDSPAQRLRRRWQGTAVQIQGDVIVNSEIVKGTETSLNTTEGEYTELEG
jgi:hypothetical protein